VVKFKNEIAAFASRQIAECRSLVRKGGNSGRDVSRKFGCGDHAITVQIGAAVEPLQESPGEYGVAIRAVVRDLLVHSASREHFARGAAGDLQQVIADGQGSTPASQGEAAVAGVHDEKNMFGRNGFGDVLKIGHRNGQAFVVGQVSVDGDDVAEIASGGEMACCAMPGEENEDAVFTLDKIRVGQLVSEKGQNVLPRGVLVQKQENMIGLEGIFFQQKIAHALQ